ncbi:DUF2254 domain-containing protein [Methylobacterium brachythecii]|uniref:Putative membrane protein n=1 Tax=Methylobacterium brachythecii TaxID=1176177 RepID=A0A7W6AH90_9HYPH|nr:DUF2254 domain-containing protein [Methylobacterium brachythecii]MBB3901425.1 putative membrane protein [Methylobacterium brachythecii]GLS42999.1 hypothetical protein GCM10007884_09840 [Methylobacterium brachythecii]
MFSNGYFHLKVLSRRPWIRVALFCFAAVVAALAASGLGPFIPSSIASSIGSEAVDQILSILATSMLPVATFSLSTMVQAYGSATSNVTPRAVPLLLQDTRAQTALASFIGAFLYSVVGLIALKTDYYGQQGRVVMFAVTLVVMVLVVATLIRWIDTLSELGRVGTTIDLIEAAAGDALKRRAEMPHLGGRPWQAAPAGSESVTSRETGYVQHVDTRSLDAWAEKKGVEIHLAVVPGSFVHGGCSIAEVTGSLDEDDHAIVRRAFVVGDRRVYENDPRFGIIALSEVASRALSPAVNDPGTAIDVIGTLVRVLEIWATRDRSIAEEPDFPRLYVQGLTVEDLFEDGFTPIARDGAGLVEVGIRLQKALAALGRIGSPDFAPTAERHASLAIKRAQASGMISEDVEAITAAAGRS